MCGRYRLTAKERWLREYFNIPAEDIDWAARWNIAPTDEVATIRQSPRAEENLREDALGADSLLGKRQILRGQGDQRCLRDGG